jgi:hypothetical protein
MSKLYTLPKKPTFLELHKNSSYTDLLTNSLCAGLSGDLERFKDIIRYVVNNKYQLFDIDDFKGSLYEDEDNILELILPSIRRVYGKVYVTPPTILKDQRLLLFQELFDIDEFIDYLINMFKITKNCLKEFKYLDRTVETLSLIVDNYVSELIEKSKDCDDYTQAIRDLRLKKVTK